MKTKIFRRKDGFNIKIQLLNKYLFISSGYSKNKNTPFYRMKEYKVIECKNKTFKEVLELFQWNS